MKPPKEPKKFNYPRLYWRTNFNPISADSVAEAVIIYPGPKMSERTNLTDSCFYEHPHVACWDDPGLNPKERINSLKKMGRSVGYKTVFLGEIK